MISPCSFVSFRFFFFSSNFGRPHLSVKFCALNKSPLMGTQVNKSALFFLPTFWQLFFFGKYFLFVFYRSPFKNRSKMGRPTFLPTFFFSDLFTCVLTLPLAFLVVQTRGYNYLETFKYFCPRFGKKYWS